MKFLNLFAGLGGNRMGFPSSVGCEIVEVTAVENNPQVAAEYKRHFPDDIVIVCDAHQYLLAHFAEFDFIWSSPPCQTHSRLNFTMRNRKQPHYIDAKLWQEIMFLRTYYKGFWVVENVVPFYKPFVEPTVLLDRHYFWASFAISPRVFHKQIRISEVGIKKLQEYHKYNIITKLSNKRQCLRNMVNCEIANYVISSIPW